MQHVCLRGKGHRGTVWQAATNIVEPTGAIGWPSTVLYLAYCCQQPLLACHAVQVESQQLVAGNWQQPHMLWVLPTEDEDGLSHAERIITARALHELTALQSLQPALLVRSRG